MKFLEILEKAWLAAAILGVLMGTFNLVTKQKFDYLVYFPFICTGFCILIYMNIRGQRRFVEKMKKDSENKPEEPKSE
ncbi:MAG: hypothetical protein JWO03_3049 [Bacteroidetes bacterium]|nr:hypothetical protein [Bacteroidota bacterium]